MLAGNLTSNEVTRPLAGAKTTSQTPGQAASGPDTVVRRFPSSGNSCCVEEVRRRIISVLCLKEGIIVQSVLNILYYNTEFTNKILKALLY